VSLAPARSRAAAADPIRFEVIRNALSEVTEEMALTLRRSAYSTNVKTRADFSCALFDAELRTVVQANTQPVHLGSLSQLVPRAVRAFGADRLGPGDGLLVNDPYGGGSHLNDITLIGPVHHDGRLIGYVANLAHHVDVGGGAPASIGAFEEIHQEGVIVPPVKLVQDGEVVDDVFRLVLAQIRSKRETAGDMRAQIAANTTGMRRLAALFARFGADVVIDDMAELISYVERRARAELAALPHGTFRATGQLDSDGFTDQPVRLAGEVRIDNDGVAFDLTGSDPQRPAPVNSTYAMSFAACAYVLKALIDPDVPVNEGLYRLVRMTAPRGTVVNCTPPAPVVGGWETNMRLTDVLLRALADVLPDRIPAGTKAMVCHAGFGASDPQTGEYWCFLETIAGGYGGRLGLDGPDAVHAHGQNTENAPIEETERNYPVRIVRYGLVEDSEGPGAHRGGLGVRRDYVFPDAVRFTVLADRDREGPWGLHGGLAGQPATYVAIAEDGTERPLGAKSTIALPPGEIVSYRTCGGGGYGPPGDRDPQLVLADVRDGKVSRQRAADVYGVAIDEQLRVDDTATRRLRDREAGR
jgi:N-methylhydantoinase B